MTQPPTIARKNNLAFDESWPRSLISGWGVKRLSHLSVVSVLHPSSGANARGESGKPRKITGLLSLVTSLPNWPGD